MYGLLDTTLDSKQTDPPHIMVARADEEVVHAHEQITRAHEEIGRTEEQLSKLEHDAARHPSDHPRTRINTFRPAVPTARPSLGRRAVRAFIGLTLTACIGLAAIAWQSPSYGNAAKQMIAEWVPQSVLTSFPALPARPAVQPGAARVAAPQPAPPAQAAPQGVAPTAAAESVQLVQSMARDLATLGQRIEQIKASIDQLKISQQQMSHDIPKASESKSQNLPPKLSSSPPRPIATSTRKPVPTLPSPQATAQPQVEKTQVSSAPRAPMR
jgi:hypothetical protein